MKVHKPHFYCFSSILALAISSSSLLFSATSAAQLPDIEMVVENINAVNEGEFVSRKMLMTMTDKRGKTRNRHTQGYRKFFGDEKRSVLFYLKPSNVKGTGFLTYDYKDIAKDDDQWLYLPALRKVRRISSSDRGDYFLGTDMTYEDMKLEGKLEPTDYHYSILAEETIANVRTIKVQGIPQSDAIAKELGYSKNQFWVDTSNWVIIKAQYWGLRGKLLKTLTNSDIRLVDNIWTRHNIEVINHKTKHTTRFTFSDVDYTTQVKNSLFRKNSLSKGR